MKKLFASISLLAFAVMAVPFADGTAEAASSRSWSSKHSVQSVMKMSISSKKAAISSKKSSKAAVQSSKKAAKQSSAAACVVLGNISDKKEKIFHVPGCPNYTQTKIETTKGERIFCTEADAVAAGWRKAKNCPGM